jgi:hypothetical protein
MSKRNYRESWKLYRAFTNSNKTELLTLVGLHHKDQFDVTKNSGILYDNLYIDQLERYNEIQELKKIPGGDLCAKCHSHFLNTRPSINHSKDLKTGAKLEQKFNDYINDYFEYKGYGLRCLRADDVQLNMPDFISVGKKVKGALCYSHSLTLDSDEKLDKQFKLIQQKRIEEKTVYLYWYDIPCIKGFFWQSYFDVYEKSKSSTQYERKISPGDFQGGKKTGHTEKVYLELHRMKDIFTLIEMWNTTP